ACLLESGDRGLILALKSDDAGEGVQALRHTQMPRAQNPRSYLDGLPGKLARFRQPPRVAAEEREVVGALRIIGGIDPYFGFADFEPLPQEALAVLLVSGSVFQKSQPVQAVPRLFRIGCGRDRQFGDSNRLLQIALGIELLGLPVER